jgi:hypothetical protein
VHDYHLLVDSFLVDTPYRPAEFPNYKATCPSK